MGRQIEQGGMEADRVAVALQQGRFQIIVQLHTGQPAPGSEDLYMPAQEADQALVEVVAQKDLRAPAQ